MLSLASLIFLVILCVLMGGTLLKLWLSHDKSAIWSPLTFICLTLLYYVVLPSTLDLSILGANHNENQFLFYIAACLFYVCVLIGFSAKTKSYFKRWNSYFNVGNAKIYGICIFIFGLICYIPFRGFRTTIWAEDAGMLADRTGFVSYFIDLISIFCGACGLLYMDFKYKHNKISKGLVFFVVLYLTLVVYIVGGFRIRILFLVLALATIYHLFPSPQKLNYKYLIPVAIVVYLGFAILESVRTYGTGINKSALNEYDLTSAENGARENCAVCCFSIIAIDHYQRFGDYVYFEPIVNAICMPLPRVLFPWKPDGDYIRTMQVKTIGSSDGGAACLSFVEAFISFGWFGVVLYGLFMGWLAKMFWVNYKRNPQSMGAILLLALFNGFCYQWISRGYLASNFNSYIYYVIMPFWLTALFRKVLPKSLTHE